MRGGARVDQRACGISLSKAPLSIIRDESAANLESEGSHFARQVIGVE
jgi:hypothetical protein